MQNGVGHRTGKRSDLGQKVLRTGTQFVENGRQQRHRHTGLIRLDKVVIGMRRIAKQLGFATLQLDRLREQRLEDAEVRRILGTLPGILGVGGNTSLLFDQVGRQLRGTIDIVGKDLGNATGFVGQLVCLRYHIGGHAACFVIRREAVDKR